MLDQDGDIIQYELKKPVEFIEESDYFGISSMEAIGVSREKYESYIDALIYSACKSIPEPGDVTDSHRVQDWLLVEDGIRAHVASKDARLDEKLLDCALSDRLEFSMIAMAISSMTANCGNCDLFESNMEQAATKTRAEIGSTTAGQSKEVTLKLLSKIWTILFKMEEETLRVTSQLNRHGENTSLARNLGTNYRMLRYWRIKSHFSLIPFSSPLRQSPRGDTHTCRFSSLTRVLSKFIL